MTYLISAIFALSLWLTFLALHAASIHLIGRAKPDTINTRAVVAALSWGLFYFLTH